MVKNDVLCKFYFLVNLWQNIFFYFPIQSVCNFWACKLTFICLAQLHNIFFSIFSTSPPTPPPRDRMLCP